MTRDEAQKALDEGKRIRHPHYEGSKFFFQVEHYGKQYVLSEPVNEKYDPWAERSLAKLDCIDGWELYGWVLYEPEAQKPAPACEVRCERCANENNLFTCLYKFNPPKDGLDQWCEFFWPADPSEWRCETCRVWFPCNDRYGEPGKCVSGSAFQDRWYCDRCGQWKCRIPERR